MRIWLSLVLLWYWTGLCMAQTVPVRAGEHATFTRLVFDLPERISFELQKSSGKAVLKLGRRGLRLDTSRVFNRIPKTRLTEITGDAESGSIMLSLGCDCDINTFWHGSSLLVVDIVNPTSQGSQEAGNSPAQEAAPAGAPPALPALSELAMTRPGAAAQQFVRASPVRTSGKVPSETSTVASSTAPDGMRKAREDLLRKLARAASQGLVSPRKTLPELDTHSGNLESPTRDQFPAGEKINREVMVETLRSVAARNLQVHVETGIDRDIRETVLAEAGSPEPGRCPDPQSLDVTQWGRETSFWEQLGPIRSRLMGEFDKPDVKAVMDLARLYIYFGFGAEARQTLMQFGLAQEDAGGSFEAAVILDMATILERGNSDQIALRMEFLDCGPMPALWAALSQNALPRNRPLDVAAILQGFTALPPHLRALLGPLLVRRLREAGYFEESDQIRRVLRRSEKTLSPEQELLEAEIALDDGRPQGAETRLEALVEENIEPSAEALLRLIDERLENDAEISYDLAQLAGAYAMEHRADRLSDNLARAYILALAGSGAFDQAFLELSRFENRKLDIASPVITELMLLLVKRGDDFEFLKHTLAIIRQRPADLGSGAVVAIAQRLFDLGFPELAAELLETDHSGAQSRERKLLRAQIALEQNRPRQAEEELRELDGEDVDRLRGRALSMLGEHQAAASVFRNAKDHDEAWREAWLAGEWENLSDLETGPVFAVANRRLIKGYQHEPTPKEEEILLRDRDLIDDSAKLREILAELLTAHPQPGSLPPTVLPR